MPGTAGLTGASVGVTGMDLHGAGAGLHPITGMAGTTGTVAIIPRTTDTITGTSPEDGAVHTTQAFGLQTFARTAAPEAIASIQRAPGIPVSTEPAPRPQGAHDLRSDLQGQAMILIRRQGIAVSGRSLRQRVLTLRLRAVAEGVPEDSVAEADAPRAAEDDKL